MILTTCMTLAHNKTEGYIDVLNCTYSIVYRYYYEEETAWFLRGHYLDGKFYEFSADIRSEVGHRGNMPPALKDYVATYLEVKPSLAAKYNTPSQVAQVWVAIANLCETLNEDHAMVAIANYLDIPYQWCMDACNGLSEPYCLVGYILAELCPTDESIVKVREYLPREYWCFAPLEAELPDQEEDYWDEDCQALWDKEFPNGTPTL